MKINLRNFWARRAIIAVSSVPCLFAIKFGTEGYVMLSTTEDIIGMVLCVFSMALFALGSSIAVANWNTGFIPNIWMNEFPSNEKFQNMVDYCTKHRISFVSNESERRIGFLNEDDYCLAKLAN